MKKKASPLIRTICGVLGFAGTSAIAFNAVRDGIQPSVILAAQLFGGFLFLYVSFFGVLPWETAGTEHSDQ